MSTDIDKLAADMREAAVAAQKIAPGEWETDSERQDGAPGRYDEYALFDGEGRRMCGTENSDASFGLIEHECDGYAWNEPSKRLMEYIRRTQPSFIITLLDDRDQLIEDLTAHKIAYGQSISKKEYDALYSAYSKLSDALNFANEIADKALADAARCADEKARECARLRAIIRAHEGGLRDIAPQIGRAKDPEELPSLTRHERDVLQMVGGLTPFAAGARVTACVERLSGLGLITLDLSGAPDLTEHGRQVLSSMLCEPA